MVQQQPLTGVVTLPPDHPAMHRAGCMNGSCPGCTEQRSDDERRDSVNHPSHYNSHPSGIECIDIVEHMPFNVGNAVKYVWRAGLKESAPAEQDFAKAIWYLQREVDRLKKLGVLA